MAKFVIRVVSLALSCCSPAYAQDPSAEGQKIYSSNCAECHGQRLVNDGSAFDLRTLKADERSRFDASVMNGKGMMPPWKGILTPAELAKLWAYVRSKAYE